MTIEEAQKLLAEVAAQRLRWGKMYTKKDMPDKALDALAVYAAHLNQVAETQKAEIARVNRRYAALNARYRKMAKRFGVQVDEEDESSDDNS